VHDASVRCDLILPLFLEVLILSHPRRKEIESHASAQLCISLVLRLFFFYYLEGVQIKLKTFYPFSNLLYEIEERACKWTRDNGGGGVSEKVKVLIYA
jgi:hypothetical protein